MTEDASVARAALSRVGERRAEGERIRAEAMLDLRAWVVAAVAAGVSISEVARLSGVTRPTVYAIIGRAPTSGT